MYVTWTKYSVLKDYLGFRAFCHHVFGNGFETFPNFGKFGQYNVRLVRNVLVLNLWAGYLTKYSRLIVYIVIFTTIRGLI